MLPSQLYIGNLPNYNIYTTGDYIDEQQKTAIQKGLNWRINDYEFAKNLIKLHLLKKTKIIIIIKLHKHKSIENKQTTYLHERFSMILRHLTHFKSNFDSWAVVLKGFLLSYI